LPHLIVDRPFIKAFEAPLIPDEKDLVGSLAAKKGDGSGLFESEKENPFFGDPKNDQTLGDAVRLSLWGGREAPLMAREAAEQFIAAHGHGTTIAQKATDRKGGADSAGPEPPDVGKKGRLWRAVRGDVKMRGAAELDASFVDCKIANAEIVEQLGEGLVVTVKGDLDTNPDTSSVDSSVEEVELPLVRLPIRVGKVSGWVTKDATNAGGPVYFEPFTIGEKGKHWRALRDDIIMREEPTTSSPKVECQITEGVVVEQREPAMPFCVAGDDVTDRRGRLLELSITWLPIRVGNTEGFVVPDAKATGGPVYFEELKLG
jgi:hypothetical protein